MVKIVSVSLIIYYQQTSVLYLMEEPLRRHVIHQGRSDCLERQGKIII